jgi:hypothetical protein
MRAQNYQAKTDAMNGRVVHLITLLVLLIGGRLLESDVNAQSAIIQGRVVDDETGDPLPTVNVFIDQTGLGSATDRQGRYRIDKLPPGSYVVVASMIGFSVESTAIEVRSGDTSHTANFRLKPVVTGLDTLQVEEELPRRWRRRLELFTNEFLGQSSNGRQSEILNPYMLEFSDEGGIFRATAPEPLIIENNALGYRITYILTEFEMDRPRGMIRIQGPFHFEEMEPQDERQRLRWTEQRERAFQGSLQHLLWSLLREVPFFQGFTVRIDRRYNAPFSGGQESELFSTEDVQLFEPTDYEHMHRMRFSDYLYVKHRDEVSWIEMAGYEAYVHESGYVYAAAHSPGSLIVYGDLSRRRVADLLPREYGLMPRRLYN